MAWPVVLGDAARGTLQPIYEAGQNTGIATDSARVSRANRWARLIARPCRHLFTSRPLPGLPMPAPDDRYFSLTTR